MALQQACPQAFTTQVFFIYQTTFASKQTTFASKQTNKFVEV